MTPIKNLSLTFEVKNIGNEQVSDVMGYPLPGISFFGTISYKYSHAPTPVNGDGADNQPEEGEF